MKPSASEILRRAKEIHEPHGEFNAYDAVEMAVLEAAGGIDRYMDYLKETTPRWDFDQAIALAKAGEEEEDKNCSCYDGSGIICKEHFYGKKETEEE